MRPGINAADPRNKIQFGILFGFILPLIMWAFLYAFFDLLSMLQLSSLTDLSPNFRMRTITILAIAANLIPFRIFNKRNYLQAMRGLVFPTVLYAVIWFFYYGIQMIG